MNQPTDFRGFLKSHFRMDRQLEESVPDQQKGVPAPPVEEPYSEDAELVDLVPPESITVGNAPLRSIIEQRESRRSFTNGSLTLEELSFLLWATQGMKQCIETRSGLMTRRTVPSGGARHSFETYLIINRVDGVEPGLYRYLPLEHKLLFIRSDEKLPSDVSTACVGQKFVGEGAVVFIWTAIPYRMEWRYTSASSKVIAVDVGHVCQNLYLASEAIGAGTCAIGAYHQEQMDELLGVDGEDEFTIYAAPVGKIDLEG